MKEKIDIAVCTDERFFMPTGVMMISVCENNPETDIVFHIIVDDNVQTGVRKDLQAIVAPYSGKSVVFYNTKGAIQNKVFPKGMNRNDITKAAYYRLYLAELLPQELDRVLYLDGDLIVRHSLLPLWNINLENKALAAVSDASSGLIEFYNRLKYPSELGYFNSGVLLVNLKYWREHQVLRAFESYMERCADSIKYWDQDVLNVMFCEQKVLMPIKYNLQRGFLLKNRNFDYRKVEKELTETLANPCIVHYTNSYKPWKRYIETPHPFNSTWDKYQDMTKWKGIIIESRTVRQRARHCAGNILRGIGLLSPLEKESIYLDVAPID